MNSPLDFLKFEFTNLRKCFGRNGDYCGHSHCLPIGKKNVSGRYESIKIRLADKSPRSYRMFVIVTTTNSTFQK